MKRNVKLASGIMLFALIGLLAFQAYWISSVYQENKENFETDVKSALTSANKSLVIQKLGLLQGLSVDVSSGNSISITLSDTLDLGSSTSFFDFNASASKHYIISDTDSHRNTMYLKGSVRRQPHFLDEAQAVLPIIANSYATFSSGDFVFVDSLLRTNLKMKGLHKDYFLGFWDKGHSRFSYMNRHVKDSTRRGNGFTTSTFSLGSPDPNELYLEIPQEDVLQASLAGMAPIITASVLMLLLLISAWYYIVRSLQKQYRLAQIKDDFIGNMTHELKTPVTASSIALEVMAKNRNVQEDQKLQDLLLVAQHEQKRILQIVNSILDNTSAEESIKENAESINISEELEVIVESMRLKVVDRMGSLDISIIDNEAYAVVNRMHFQNAVLNILDNALKYSDKVPRIRVSISSDESSIEIQISDNGMGISLEDRKRIFDKFFRVHTGNVHTVKGYGLGLSYTKTVIEQFGGSIKVESKIGEGSTFFIKIPRAIHES